MALQNVLGTDMLLSKSGPTPVSSIEGKNLLIYFSAHWCGPCRQFTPMLSRFYQQLKEQRSDFEIVFVSGDRSQAEFEGYFKEHPWLALPFGGDAEKKIRDKLNKKFKVRGIPSLVLLDKDGNTLSKDATRHVQQDPEGKDFPWKAKGIYEILSTTDMKRKDGSALTVADLKKHDAFAIYFSAHWCPPCRGFTPVLTQTYKKLKEAGNNMEIIFVSSDKDVESYQDYYNDMPWATVTFGGSSVGALKQTCEVSGIPTLVTCKGVDGSIINTGARGPASSDVTGAEFPWPKKPLPVCGDFNPRSNESVIDCLNEDACVVLNVDGVDNKDAAVAEFKKAAEQYAALFKKEGVEEDYPVHFFVNATAESADLYGRVLEALKAPPVKPGAPANVMVMHLDNNLAHATLTGEISAQSVLKHVDTFKKAHAQ